jgi:hypothetical protein
MTLEQPFKDNANLPDPEQVGAGTMGSPCTACTAAGVGTGCWLLAAGFPHPCTGQRRTANAKQARALTSTAPHPPTDLLLQGWSPERSMRLGGSMLDAVLAVAPKLR